LLEAATFAAEDAYPPTDLETRANMFRGMGNIFEVPRQVMFVSAAASLPGVQLIGEIGFNAGHSAITALWSNENATLVSFDTQDLDWSKQSLSFVSRIYPHRIDRVKGPSQVTIPVFASKDARKLDMLFVDGVHSGDTPYPDIVNGRRNTLCGCSWCTPCQAIESEFERTRNIGGVPSLRKAMQRQLATVL
jgi:predicted O-methyltransferase YrrM